MVIIIEPPDKNPTLNRFGKQLSILPWNINALLCHCTEDNKLILLSGKAKQTSKHLVKSFSTHRQK